MFNWPYMVIKGRCVWNKTFLLVPLCRIMSFHVPVHLFSQCFYICVISAKAGNQVIHSLYKVGRNGNNGINRFKNTKKKLPSVGLDLMQGIIAGLWVQHQTNWTTEAFACSTETLGSLYSHTLLILTKWSKSNKEASWLYAELKSHISFLAKSHENSLMRLCGSSLIRLCGRSLMRLCGSSLMRLCGSSLMRLCGRSLMRLYSKSLMRLCGSSLMRLCGSSLMRLCGSSLMRLCSSSLMRLCGSSLMRLCGSSLMRLCGSSLMRLWQLLNETLRHFLNETFEKSH